MLYLTCHIDLSLLIDWLKYYWTAVWSHKYEVDLDIVIWMGIRLKVLFIGTYNNSVKLHKALIASTVI